MKFIKYFLFIPLSFGFFFQRPYRKKINFKYSVQDFIGVWNIQEEDLINIINIEECGKISKLYDNNYKMIGSWEKNNNDFFITMKTSDKDKNYYGKIKNNTFISGEVCEGNISPYYIGKFNMNPLFFQFHNISNREEIDKDIYINYKNITGKWIIENTHTINIYCIEIYENNTWNSLEGLKGIWNLYNKTENINLNTPVQNIGKNIWLAIKRNMNKIYIESDILFVGNIVQFGKIYLNSELLPCSCDSNIISVVSKINGSIVYSFDNEPEISEKFYMKRWWN
jgi:hypothetical protein